MDTGYKIYRNTADAHILASVLNNTCIDKILVHIFKFENDLITFQTYQGDDMKVDTPGRIIWSEITWTPSKKWVEITPKIKIDIGKCIEAISCNESNENLIYLKSHFEV